MVTCGHGATPHNGKPAEPTYTTRGFADYALGVLDHPGIARAHCHGISMGGQSRQRSAIDYPERVGAVVPGCAAPGSAPGSSRPPAVSAMMANGPVLVSQVRADFIFPAANVMPLAERIPGERLYLVAGGRHGYFLEFSDEAGGLVVDFLQGHRLG